MALSESIIEPRKPPQIVSLITEAVRQGRDFVVTSTVATSVVHFPSLILERVMEECLTPARTNCSSFSTLETRRDRSQNDSSRAVPLAHVREGINWHISTTILVVRTASRLNTTPNCISFQSAAQTAARDPRGIGVNAALLALSGHAIRCLTTLRAATAETPVCSDLMSRTLGMTRSTRLESMVT